MTDMLLHWVGKGSHLAIAVIGGIIVLQIFKWGEQHLRKDKKSELVTDLRSASLAALVALAPHRLAIVIDRIFGQQLFSLRAFFTSATISITLLLSLLVAFIFYYRLDPNSLFDYVDSRFPTPYRPRIAEAYPFLGSPQFVVLLMLAVNIAVDFVSLIVTRAIINYLRSRRSGSLVVGLVLMDFVISYAVFALPTFVLTRLFYSAGDVVLTWSAFPFILEPRPFRPIFMAYSDVLTTWYRLSIASSMFTSLFTSIWLWLYVGATVILWVLKRIAPSVRRVVTWIDFETHPLEAMAPVGAIVFVLCYLAIVGGLNVFSAALSIAHDPYILAFGANYPTLPTPPGVDIQVPEYMKNWQMLIMMPGRRVSPQFNPLFPVITIALLLAMIYRHTHQQKLDVQQLARTTAFMIVCVLLLSTGPALEMLAQWLVISISGQYPMPLSRLVQAFWLPKNLLMSVYFGSFVGAITAYAAFVAKPKYRLFTTAVAATAAMVAYDLYIQLARDVHAQLSREGLLEPGFFGSVAADVIGGPIAAWIVVYIFGARLPGSLARNQRDPNAVIARGGKRNARGRRGAGKRRHDMR